MSAPRTKRQFAGASSDPAQRRITSFFASSGSISPSASSDDPLPRTFASADASVQSNLLSVGMRVRKAVPEGYKSGTYSAFSLWDENKKVSSPVRPTYAASQPRSSAVSTPRELLPFCGIHKVGGLDTQESSAADDFAFDSIASGLIDHDTMDDIPGLTLSQESVESNDSIDFSTSGTRTRKRFFADEDPEVPDRLTVPAWQDVEVSPRSLAPVDLGNGRRMAIPRKGGIKGKLGGGGGSRAAGQENLMVVDDDFEEAMFLDPSFEVDMNDL